MTIRAKHEKAIAVANSLKDIKQGMGTIRMTIWVVALAAFYLGFVKLTEIFDKTGYDIVLYVLVLILFGITVAAADQGTSNLRKMEKIIEILGNDYYERVHQEYIETYSSE
jgi:uncharacterized oligopeptide transporter (OPT) family protein